MYGHSMMATAGMASRATAAIGNEGHNYGLRNYNMMATAEIGIVGHVRLACEGRRGRRPPAAAPLCRFLFW